MTHIFPNLNIKRHHLVWGFHALILSMLILTDGHLYRGFHAMFDWMANHSFFLLEELTKSRHWEFFEEMGCMWAAVLIWIFIWGYDINKRKYFLPFLVAVIVSVTIYTILQHSVGKIRPEKNDGIPFYFPFMLGWNIPYGLAFPSGHATFAFCLVSLLAYIYPQKKYLFWCLGIACALSRVINHAHFFSDIYAGALIGFGTMNTILNYFKLDEKPNLLSNPLSMESRNDIANQDQQKIWINETELSWNPSDLNEKDRPVVSIVIPIKNEEENIRILADEIEDVMNTTPWTYEVIWINDGSSDQSRLILDKLSLDYPSHRVIHLPCNLGQSAAQWYGFMNTCAKIIVTMDGDGQNDPRDIPSLVVRIETNATDVANGYRQLRKDSWHRRKSSKIANACRNKLTGKTVRDVGCSIRAFRRECIEHLPLFRGMHRFLPTLFKMQGFRVEEHPVNHRPRTRGKTKYSINNRLWVGLFDLTGIMWLQKRGFYPNLKTFRKLKTQNNSGERHSNDFPIQTHEYSIRPKIAETINE